MLQNILKLAFKILAGIFLFYLFISIIVLPLGLKYALKIQGTKILNHKVKVRKVHFNPFSWRLSINGVQILDKNSQPMVKFDKLFVDVSLSRLLKKQYHLQGAGIMGMKLNVTLLPDGTINLLSLVPPSSPVAETKARTQPTPEQPKEPALDSASQAPAAAPAPATKSNPMPEISISKFIIHNSQIYFTDQSLTPNFILDLNGMDLTVTDIVTRPDAQIKLLFTAKLDEKGTISLESVAKPFAQPIALEAVFNLNNYALEVLTPYTGKFAGRTVEDGKLNFSMNYRVSENKLTATHKILVQNFNFGHKVESKDALNLPFGLAVALLEDPEGRIRISLPAEGDMSDPQFNYGMVISDVVKNFFSTLVTKPFMFLMSALGSETGTEEISYIRFLPAKTEIAYEEKEKLQTLLKGLKERPKLSLEINGTYEEETDWKAIKVDAFNHDFDTLKKESTKTDESVLQTLYQRKYGMRGLWLLTKSYKLKEGHYDNEKINAEIRRKLIEDAPADKNALEALALGRAQAIYDFIINSGFDSARVKIGPVRKTASALGFIPLEFTFTVFDAEKEKDKSL